MAGTRDHPPPIVPCVGSFPSSPLCNPPFPGGWLCDWMVKGMAQLMVDEIEIPTDQDANI